MIKKLFKAYKRHMIYRDTYRELSKMSDKELKDLGLSRSMLDEVARDSTYGNEKPIKLDLFKMFFKAKTEKDIIEEYLAESANTIDLENRIKNVERGLAPWQIRAKTFAQGWAL